MSNGPKVGEKKKFNLPHVFIILFCIMIICAIATYIIPAGTFDYQENADGRSVAVPGTWHAYEKGAEGSPSPVGPFRLFELVYEGMCNAADISFLVFITYCSVTFIIKSGAFEGAVGALLKIFKGDSSLITIPIFIALIGAGSSTVGMFEEWLPFIPVFAAIYTGMGYDALTGLMVIAFGAGMGYSGAIMNPFTVGVAQGIAEVPYMSGTGYRLICHAVMIIIASIFIIRYAIKVKKDPENSYVYGIEGLVRKEGEDVQVHGEFTLAHKLVLLDLIVTIVLVIVGVMKWGWYFSQICAIFLIMAIVAAIIMRWNLHKVGDLLVAGFMEATTAAMMIGIARGVKLVLQEGGIIDTVVNGMSMPLSHMPLAISAICMLIVQTILNFFIPSGSGQAAVSMPIMAPLADILGMNRDVAVLAYQFGDGLSNIIWPTAFAAVVSGLAKVPLERYWKLAFKLFGLLVVAQAILMAIAVAINFGG
ncbi:MAG: YfcC family protein [Firmicutes bacterium]|nr:YfcC family protein [Bacillota bacterium]